MTAVAAPPSFPQINRPGWNINGSQSLNSDDVRGMFLPRKAIQRTNSSSSISSNSSNSSTTTVATNGSQSNGTAPSTNSDMSTWSNPAARKRPQQPKGPWPTGKTDAPSEFGRIQGVRPPMNGMNGGSLHQPTAGASQMASQAGMSRPMAESMPSAQPTLYLLSLNGTFERKTISVPFYPDSLRIGRQTNQKTIPTPTNGFFDSKVLSRQHAEIWADRMGKIFIRDVKSSNGTFVNGTRLSQENRESEPHELQTADHLELGIDIVSEDQKTVVHHKVAAKVEHAGFMNASGNVMDMNFGDLDPANGSMMMPSPGAMQYTRGRAGSNAAVVSNGRLIQGANVAAGQNGMGRGAFWLTPITTEHIVKRLHNEMRSARLQSQDLTRTSQFIGALLSKDDIKDLEKPEVPEPPKHLANGNALPFRTDPKARFSDPPAPPPQQPLPEKPDVPSLKRGTTERPKSHPSNTSPIRQDNNLGQIIQLTDALNNAKKELDAQTARMRELEEMLQQERERRELAEDLAKRLEEPAPATIMNGAAKLGNPDALLEEAFEPPRELEPPAVAAEAPPLVVEEVLPPVEDQAETIAKQLQARIDTMAGEMRDMKQQMEAWKQRCEKAEMERDADRQSLQDMVLQIRQEEEARRITTEERSRSQSKRRQIQNEKETGQETPSAAPPAADDTSETTTTTADQDAASLEDPTDKPTLSRANTITPLSSPTTKTAPDPAIVAGIPYASMLGVVLIGMGVMAYLNGWQPQPKPGH